MEEKRQMKKVSADAMLLADAMGESADNAETLETVMKKVQSTVRTTVKYVRKFLADFDELQRLTTNEVSVSSVVKDTDVEMLNKVTEGSVDYRVRKLVKLLDELFMRLGDHMENTTYSIGHTQKALLLLQQYAQEVSDKLRSVFLQAVEQMRQSLFQFAQAATSLQKLLEDPGFSNFHQTVSKLLLPALQKLNEELALLQSRQRLISSWMPEWGNQWRDLAQTVRQSVNDVISYCNGLMSAMAKTVNTMGFYSSLLPGNTHIPTYVTPPKIPALAQGAVLPANQPFLAVVGDQRHGTNVEAPLATIQEAVAAVTADQTGAIVAGFEASVGVQREILEAVLGISIGDETVANACRRYERKMAVVRGG